MLWFFSLQKSIDIWPIYDFKKIQPLETPKTQFFQFQLKNLFHPNILFVPFFHHAKFTFFKYTINI